MEQLQRSFDDFEVDSVGPIRLVFIGALRLDLTRLSEWCFCFSVLPSLFSIIQTTYSNHGQQVTKALYLIWLFRTGVSRLPFKPPQ